MLELLAILLGIAYGYMTPGRQNKMELLKTATLIGIVLGIVLGLLAWFSGVSITGAAGATLGLIAIAISAFIIAVLFVLGAWIGDFLEDRFARKA